MKRTLLITNAATLILAAVFACLYYTRPVCPTSSGEITTRPSSPSGGDSCCIITDTYGHTYAEFLDVTRNYKAKVWDLLYQNYIVQSQTLSRTEGGPGENSLKDARSIWFSVDTLKQFLCTIERYNNMLAKPYGKLGVRMFYAAYGDDHDNYSFHHTLFMVPTFKKGTDNVDFDPRYMVRNNIPVDDKYRGALRNIMPTGSTKMLMLGGDPENGTVRNKGELCPPNCPEPSTFDVIDNP